MNGEIMCHVKSCEIDLGDFQKHRMAPRPATLRWLQLFHVPETLTWESLMSLMPPGKRRESPAAGGSYVSYD